MRQPAVRSSRLTQPLDYILGTIGAVRVLRQLVLHGGVMSAKLLAQRTKLNRRGVSEILARLASDGVIENIPTAGISTYRFDAAHPLSEKLSQLFRGEALLQPDLYRAIEKAGKKHVPKLKAVWLFGSAARGDEHAGSDIDLAFVSRSPVDVKSESALLEKFSAVGRRFHAKLIPIFMTEAELRKLKRHNPQFRKALLRDGRSILGPSPVELLRD